MGRTRRLMLVLGLLQGGAFLLLAVLAVLPLFEGPQAPLWMVLMALAVAATITWLLDGLITHHFDDLRLLRVALAQTARGELPPEQLQTRWATGKPDEVSELAGLVTEIATGRAAERARPDERLAAVIGALGEAVLVVTERGQVSLVNAAARDRLGAGRVAVGTSVYAALDRDSLSMAMASAAEADSRAVAVLLTTVQGERLPARVADFGEHRGMVITFAGGPPGEPSAVEHALDLHDLPPPAEAPGADCPLSELPVLVLDTETTGLDVDGDEIVSVGAVRLHGPRVYRGAALDQLVRPGRPIPPRSTAVHGITDAMVAQAPNFRDTLPVIRAAARHCVVVGHNIGFDLTLLRRQSAKAAADWADPPWLDVLLLAAALDPRETDLNLESIATRLGVNVSGRHTALGDALVTAEVYLRLAAQLEQRGVRTLGEAQAFQLTADHVVKAQRSAGW